MIREQLSKLGPGWLGAIAGAAAAGATIFAEHRVIGALGAGAAMTYLALRVTGTPCSCHDEAKEPAATPAPTIASESSNNVYAMTQPAPPAPTETPSNVYAMTQPESLTAPYEPPQPYYMTAPQLIAPGAFTQTNAAMS